MSKIEIEEIHVVEGYRTTFTNSNGFRTAAALMSNEVMNPPVAAIRFEVAEGMPDSRNYAVRGWANIEALRDLCDVFLKAHEEGMLVE